MTTAKQTAMRASQIKEQLDHILDPRSVNFLGVFARDTIPEVSVHTRFPACLVVNSESSNGRGEHWLAIYFLDHKRCEFFDSYAFPLGLYGLSKYLSKFIVLAQVKHPLQANDSSVCGHYCIYYLYYRSLGFTMDFITQQFATKDLISNDKNVLQAVTHNFSPYPSASHHSHCTCPNQTCLSRSMFLSRCKILHKST